MKAVYLCCTEDRRPVLEAKAALYTKDKWALTNQLERAELVAVVRDDIPTEQMKNLIRKAEELNIEVNYFSESFIKKSIHEALLRGNTRIQEQQPRTERVKTHGRER